MAFKVWVMIRLLNMANLAPWPCGALSVVAKMVHIKFDDLLEILLNLVFNSTRDMSFCVRKKKD